MTVFEDILCCPTCKGTLEQRESDLLCTACDTVYHKQEDLLDLIPPGSSDLKLSERDHYSEGADYYIYMHNKWCGSPFYRHYHRAFLDDLRRLPAGSLILETGCGLGNDGLELLSSGYRLVETDIAPGSLAEAQRLHRAGGFTETSAHLLADAENLPFATGCFDGAFMVASLHHLPDSLASLKEMRRILRQGGLFVLGTEPNSWQNSTIYPLGKLLLRVVKSLSGKEIDAAEMVSEADKLTEGFSRRQLQDLFREAGFENIELKPAGYFSAAIFFLSTELSPLTGRDLRLFLLERLTIPLDEVLGNFPLISRYPWHWNAVAY
jgi:ubiquinone/menaquinone biosynthesis C-methylase UbiE